MSFSHDSHFRQHAPPPTPHFTTSDSQWSGSSPHAALRQQSTSALTPQNVTLSMRQEPVHALATSDGKEKTRKPIDPPPIVRLDVEDRTDPNRHFLFSPHLFVMALLVPEGSEVATGRAQKGVIGETCSTIHRLKDVDNKEGGYFVFGDISVRRPGKYRLHFTLFNSEGPSHYGFLAETFSTLFTVYSSKDFQGMDESTAISRSFNEQGVRLRMRKEARSRQQVISYHAGADSDDLLQRHQSQAHLQAPTPSPYQMPNSRSYASQSMYAMDGRGIKRQREDEHEVRSVSNPASRPAYYQPQYQTSQPYAASMGMGGQSYSMQQMMPTAMTQPALGQQYFGNMHPMDPELFKAP